MSTDRRKESVCHLSMDDVDRLRAASTDEKLAERLIFLKRLYKGATLEDAADDMSAGLPAQQHAGVNAGTRAG